jgi:hypothetical protein
VEKIVELSRAGGRSAWNHPGVVFFLSQSFIAL